MLNSDMHAGYIKEDNASKYVTCPRTKISQPEILQQQQQVYFKLNIAYKACARN